MSRAIAFGRRAALLAVAGNAVGVFAQVVLVFVVIALISDSAWGSDPDPPTLTRSPPPVKLESEFEETS